MFSIELLDENMYFSGKNHYKKLYTNIVGKVYLIKTQTINVLELIYLANKDKRGQSMAHLAVRCNGSDSAFEDTANVLEEI